MKPCKGLGKPPLEVIVKAEPGVRDLRNGRGICPVCKRILALTSKGTMKNHREDTHA